MSAVVPKNYSPSLLSDRRETSISQGPAPKTKEMAPYSMPNFGSIGNMASSAGNAIIIQLIVLVAAVIAIIFVIYILFSPIISSLFGSVLDTVNGITSITAESLGTITQTLGSVITTATNVVNQVSSVGVSTISTLSNVLTSTLSRTTEVIVGDGGVNKGVLGSFEDVLKQISAEIVGKSAQGDTPAKEGILPQIGKSIVAINEAITGKTEDGVFKKGILQTITETAQTAIESFVDFVKDIGAVFFSVLNTIRTSMETVVSGIQDGIRYLVEPFLNTSYGIPAIARTLAGVVSQFNEAIKDVSSNIKSGIDSVTDAVRGLSSIFG